MQYVTPPVITTLGLLFVNKLVSEEVQSSAPMITKYRFGWSVEQVGSLSAGVGLLVVPLTICVGFISAHCEDRFILKWLTAFALLGVAIMIDWEQLGFESMGTVTVAKYVRERMQK